MNRETQRDLIARLLDLLQNRTTDMSETIATLSTVEYTDEVRYQKEVSRLFRQLPIIVGHVSEVAQPGDYISHDATGVPIVVVRQQDATLKAFANVCKHRGGRLVTESRGQGLNSLVCQYHAWSYHLDGRLRGIPHEAGFEGLPEQCRSLTALPVQEALGFIWVIPRPEAGVDTLDVATYLGAELWDDLAALELDKHVVFDPQRFERPISWKLSIDTFLENYHVRKTHRKTIDFMFLDNIGLYEQLGLHQRNLYPKKTLAGLQDQPREEWQLRPHANALYTVFPNTLILVEPDHINLSIVFPTGIDRSVLLNMTLLPEAPDEKAVVYFNKNNQILYTALEEDFTMATHVQQGLSTGVNDFFVHGRFEKGLQYFHNSVQRLTEADSLAAVLTDYSRN